MLAAKDDYLYQLFRKIGLSDLGAKTAQVPSEILLILMVALVVSRIGARFARRSVAGLVARSVGKNGASPRASSRAATLGGVADSLVRVVVWTMAVLLMIEAVGINAGPVIAGASIVGVAVGFGAQSLVKDFLSGFFVLAEDQYGVGDVVTLTDVTGTVEEVNLRTTRLRASDGTVWYVPNGEIRKVGNSAKDWSVAIIDVSIPASADVATASSAIAEELAATAQDADWGSAILEPPQVLGVESLDSNAVTLRVSAKTAPGQRARVARELRARIGARLRREGVVPLKEAAG